MSNEQVDKICEAILAVGILMMIGFSALSFGMQVACK